MTDNTEPTIDEIFDTPKDTPPMSTVDIDKQDEPIKPKFLDLVENHFASQDNPHRIGIFVRKGYRSGRLNHGAYLVFTDGKGDFWEIGNRNGHKMVIVGNALTRHTTHLKAELLAKMPKKKHHIESDRNIAYREGFNDATTEITKIVNEL